MRVSKVVSVIYLFLLCISIQNAYCQEGNDVAKNEKLDSILSKIKELGSDSIKIERYIEEGWEYYNTRIDITNLLAEKAENLARKTNNKHGLAKAKSLQGVVECLKGSHRLSNNHNEEALKLALEINDSTLISRVYNCMAVNYTKDSKTYDKAYENYTKALQHINENTERYINTKVNLTQLFSSMNLKDNELKATKEIIEITNDSKDIGKESINLSFRKRLSLMEGDTTRANELLDEMIEHNKENKLYYQIIGNYLDKSRMLRAQKKYQESLDILEECNNIVDEYGFTIQKNEVLFQKAVVYSEMGNYDKAIELLKSIAPDKKEYIRTTKKLYEIYEIKGDYKSALSYAKKYKIITDSLNNKETLATVSELETLYDSEKKEKENQLLKLQSAEIENELSSGKLLMQYLLAGLGIMLLIAMYFYSQNKQRKEYNDKLFSEVNAKTKSLKIANENLIETNKELEAFTYIAAHDLMSPLRSIISFTGLIKKKNAGTFDKSTKEYFSHIEKGSTWMNDLISDLLIFTKLNKETYTVEKVSVTKIIEEVKIHLQNQINEKKAVISLTNNINDIKVDPKRIKQVFQNLISNSIKYSNTDVPPIIDIEVKEAETEILITVCDNGIGIDEKYREVIFDPFKRLHSKDQFEGTGIGLYICKKIITNLGGKINVVNKHQCGTKILFTIPKMETT